MTQPTNADSTSSIQNSKFKIQNPPIMSPTLNDPHLRRRLALGLIAAPVHRNRRRRDYSWPLASLLIASAAFALLLALARL